MTPEDEFILSFLPILRRYLSYRKIEHLDQQLDMLEQQLKFLQLSEVGSDQESESFDGPGYNGDDDGFSTENNPPASEDESERDKLVVDLSFADLKEDVQQFITESLGFSSKDELLAKKPGLDGPICTLEI